MIHCGNKEKCCGCIPLWLGITIIGVIISLEFLLSLIFLFIRDPPSYVGDGINVALKLFLASCFLWMACKTQSLLARSTTLLAIILELIIQVTLLIVVLVYIYYSDFTEEWCKLNADNNDWVMSNGRLYT